MPSRPDPLQLGAVGRILEGIVTTINADGSPNISPMGPIVDESMDCLWLRPFRTSTTFVNLKRSRCGVFHVTDDVELFARAVVGQTTPLPRMIYPQSEGCPGFILADACRWYAFEVESLDDSTDRTSILGRVVERGVIREFFGFNRAKHAVIEAAILASRVHLLGRGEIERQFPPLITMVEKTGAAAEHRAMCYLRDFIDQSLAPGSDNFIHTNTTT
jgi:hypothetical protein